MRKKCGFIFAMSMIALSVTACGNDNEEANLNKSEEKTVIDINDTSQKAQIELWTYDIGQWGDAKYVDNVIKGFNNVYPDIKINVEYLDSQEADEKINDALLNNYAPDIIMGGPERVVSDWGASGYMVSLNELWDKETVSDIADNNLAVVSACQGIDGNYYEYPLCMYAHCMVINKEMFEAADAMKYIDENTRTWTTQNFENALVALKKYGIETPGIVYYGNKEGDEGTRALAMNLYNAQFTNGAHSEWTMDSEKGKKGITKLVELCDKGLLKDDSAIDVDEVLEEFANQKCAMSFHWNASDKMKMSSKIKFTPYAVAFPSENGKAQLAGGIKGFGIINSRNDEKIAAAKSFVKYVCDDKSQADESVRMSGFFPVKSSQSQIYAGTENESIMKEFEGFMPYLGDYYNVIPGWEEQREEWRKLFTRVLSGEDVEGCLEEYVAKCDEVTMTILKTY